MPEPNLLYYGDNLEVLRERIATDSIDLIYLDPPFNSNQTYNVLFGHQTEASAQIQAFDDTWKWTPETERVYFDLIRGGSPPGADEAIESMYRLLGPSQFMAYLVMMTPRLVELRRVLKRTGSIYLHCDPTASHYLKVLMDAIFGTRYFQNEIVWKRFSAKNDPKRYGRGHDVILFYTKSARFTWNDQYGPFEPDYVEQNYRYVEEETGRRYRLSDLTANKPGGDVSYEWHGMRPYKGRYWAFSKANMDRFLAEGRIVFRRTGMPVYKRYLDEQPGVPLQDVWTDIRLHAGSNERLGYPTQKPRALLERIIQSSSNAGDLVLDPFCGCGTTVDTAQALGRRWIGVDITYIAIDLIRRRLEDAYGSEVQFVIDGIPRDLDSAHALFTKSPFDFERWAVSLVYGQPNQKQVGDRGIDGVIRFPVDGKRNVGRVLVSVKGGQQLHPSFVRDLLGTVQTQGAEMGVLVTMAEPTRGMTDAANHAGSYTWPINDRPFPKIQLVTVQELLSGGRLNMPTPLTPYLQAPRHVPAVDQLSLG